MPALFKAQNRQYLARSGLGHDIYNKQLDVFYAKNGVVRHKTIKYSLQKNGLTKKINRTLIDKVKCMLIQSKLPKTL